MSIKYKQDFDADFIDPGYVKTSTEELTRDGWEPEWEVCACRRSGSLTIDTGAKTFQDADILGEHIMGLYLGDLAGVVLRSTLVSGGPS